ncbi:MAG: hypothetical protein AB4426_06830 [Xenococcaceae cyanobacterium]
MLPLIGIPPTIAAGMAPYRDVFCRDEGFAHVCRYVTGLILSPNKTLQGIYAQLVPAQEQQFSRRAMHEAVFEAGWQLPELMVSHRQERGIDYQGKGRAVIGLDWTLSHHDQGAKIFGVKRAYDYVDKRMSCYQTVVTAVIANRERFDGLEVVVQSPNYQEEEKAYLEMTAQETYTDMEQVQQRLIELLHYQKNRLAYRKRTEIAVAIVEQLEAEGNFPMANYAFDNGVLSLPLTQLIEKHGKHWVSELECSRNIFWSGEWRRVEAVATQLRSSHPESFRPVKVKCRNGSEKQFWAFTKTVRLKRYGKKRLVIGHEKEDLSDEPRFFLTDALHWESKRVIETWSYRWPTEIFHEFTKQVTGLESSQVRNEEAVKRHFCLRECKQSLLQRATCSGGKSERFKFADGGQTVGQKIYALTREALGQLVHLIQGLFTRGHSCKQVLEVLMPT